MGIQGVVTASPGEDSHNAVDTCGKPAVSGPGKLPAAERKKKEQKCVIFLLTLFSPEFYG
jgi:hypothetical protein